MQTTGRYFFIKMTEVFEYHPEGTCCKLIHLSITDDYVENVEFLGGCHGNLQGIAALVKGQKCEEIIHRLEGIRCGNKQTSCPDQLCKALHLFQEKRKS